MPDPSPGVIRACDPQEVPEASGFGPRRRMFCRGCGEVWWTPEDCGCTCDDPTAPNYERWEDQAESEWCWDLPSFERMMLNGGQP